MLHTFYNLSIPFLIYFIPFDKSQKVCYSSLNTNWRCTIKRKIILSFLSFVLILALIFPTACVAKRTPTTSSTGTDDDRIAALETKVSQLQSKLASLPASSEGNYDTDIENIYAELENIYEELDSVLADVDAMLENWEDEQVSTDANGTDTNGTNTTDDVDDTTRWSLDVWTDYESYNLLDIDVDSKKIEDEDDYTIWLLLTNANIKSSYHGKLSTEPSIAAIGDYYYDTGDEKMWQLTEVDSELWWLEVDFASIYTPVEIKEVIIEFSPKSSDRVIIDESQTELYSTGYPSFDWDMDFSNREDGTCKRMEATTEARFTIPVPTSFINSDPEKPNPEQFKLEFELAYK